MREATKKELEGISQYIKSVSKPTGINIFDVKQETSLQLCEDLIKTDISGTSYEDIGSDFSNEMKDMIRNIQISTLAMLIDQFSYNYDTYEYHDTVEDRELQVKKIEEDIRNGNTEYLQAFLNTVILDGIEDIDDNEVMHNVRTAQELSKNLFMLSTSNIAEITENSDLSNERE